MLVTTRVDEAARQQRKKIPLSVILALALAIALDTATQILWKAAVSDVPHVTGPLGFVAACFARPMFIAAMLLFLPKLFNWLFVLKRADLSYAKPITALSMATVCVCSAIVLKEHVTMVHLLGISLIMVGVCLIGATEHNTVEAKEAVRD